MHSLFLSRDPCLKVGRPLLSSSCIIFSPSLNNQQNFLIFLSFIAPLFYTPTNCLWISSGRKTVFKKLDRTSQTAVFPIFSFVFSNYIKLVETNTKPYHTIHMLPLTRNRQLIFTGSARVTGAAATCNRFLFSGLVSWLQNYCTEGEIHNYTDCMYTEVKLPLPIRTGSTYTIVKICHVTSLANPRNVWQSGK